MSKVAKGVGALVFIGLAIVTGGAALAGLGQFAAFSLLSAKVGSLGLRVRDRFGGEWLATSKVSS